MNFEMNGKYHVKAVSFCCATFAEQILLGEVQILPWTDHLPTVCINKQESRLFRLTHCPNCGTKITASIN